MPAKKKYEAAVVIEPMSYFTGDKKAKGWAVTLQTRETEDDLHTEETLDKFSNYHEARRKASVMFVTLMFSKMFKYLLMERLDKNGEREILDEYPKVILAK